MEIIATATPPSNSSSPIDRGIGNFPMLDATSLILGGLVIIVSIVAAIYARIPKTIQRLSNLKVHPQIQCYDCHYFSPNPYLKCSLHPDTVMTERAVDCRDYHSGITTKPFEG